MLDTGHVPRPITALPKVATVWAPSLVLAKDRPHMLAVEHRFFPVVDRECEGAVPVQGAGVAGRVRRRDQAGDRALTPHAAGTGHTK
jgi:hypothetical protein